VVTRIKIPTVFLIELGIDIECCILEVLRSIAEET